MTMTDAPNFGTKFGRRKPCLRYIGPLLGTTCDASVGHDDPGVPSGPAAPNGAWWQGIPCGDSTPIFFLAPQKENGGGAVKRKNAFRCAVTGAFTRPATQRDAALNGPAQLRQPLREHGRGLQQTSELSTPCCTLRSSGKNRI